MRTVLAAAALLGTLALSAPASAESGMQFYNQCGTGAEAGFFNRPYCHGYLTGFFDAMSATGTICHGPDINDTQIVMVVQNWLRFHAADLQHPAHLMIRNAMLNAWPCRRY